MGNIPPLHPFSGSLQWDTFILIFSGVQIALIMSKKDAFLPSILPNSHKTKPVKVKFQKNKEAKIL
jgi:hypothetical protein